MYGISSSGKEAISLSVEKMFDELAYKLLGNIPKLRNKSAMYSTVPPNTLAHIYTQVLNKKELTQKEKDILKSILTSSYGYIEALKYKTGSDIAEKIDSLVKEAKNNQSYLEAGMIAGIVGAALLVARQHMKLIAEAETTKTRNIAHSVEIAGNAEIKGIQDPSVFFVVVRDGLLCEECKRLHLLEDGVTPRVYRMSELSMGWHKRGDSRPSACGEHPNCRCTLQELPQGTGFKNGFVSFISLDHDEYQSQRVTT